MKTTIDMAREVGLLSSRANPHGIYAEALEHLAQLVRADEREACAKLVDDIEARCIAKDVDDPPLEHIATAIRARGNT
jgi:hypothetical protein